MSLIVFKDVLNHTKHNNCNERHQLSGKAIRNRNDGNHLHEGNKDEVDVSHF